MQLLLLLEMVEEKVWWMFPISVVHIQELPAVYQCQLQVIQSQFTTSLSLLQESLSQSLSIFTASEQMPWID